MLTDIMNAYIECALWASVDDNCDPLDNDFGPEDIHPDSLKRIEGEVKDFINYISKAGYLEQYTRGDEQIGHDFFLTRNHHGAGFWDRGDGVLGELLTSAAQYFGESNFYVGDDGMVHVS